MAQPTAEKIRSAVERLRVEVTREMLPHGLAVVGITAYDARLILAAAESAAADRERVEKAEKDAKRFRTLEPWQVELDGYTGDQFVWVDDDTRVAGCDIADLADALAAAPDAGQEGGRPC